MAATNFYENLLPDDNTPADIGKILTDYAASTGQYVTVASRTEAEQRRTEKGTGTGPLMVYRTDTNAIETHPNTGAAGEGWTQQTNKQILAQDIPATQGNLQTILNALLGDMSALPGFAVGVAPVNVTSDKTETFDTGGIDYSTGFVRANLPFTGTPGVFVMPYISPAGVKVEASVPVRNANAFTIRVKRNGYSAGEVQFVWFAIGNS